MKNIQKTGLLLISILFFSCQENQDNELTSPDPTDPVVSISYKEKAKQTFDLIQQNYKINSSGLYLENFPKQSDDRQSSFLWSLDALLTGVNQLKAIGYKDQVLSDPYNALDKYYDSQRLPNAYAAFPVQYSLDDRFYDDNAIIALELIEDYEINKNQASLDRAIQQVDFSITGEDSKAGGGIYWVEQYKNKPESDLCNKAVCATAFTTTYLLKLYQHTKNEEYLKFAKRLYLWLNANTQDPVDHLFWNDIRVRDNFVNKTKWTYNSGAMITNNILLWTLPSFGPIVYYFVLEISKAVSGYNDYDYAGRQIAFPKIEWLKDSGYVLLFINLLFVMLVLLYLSKKLKQWRGIAES